jgi:hypothetical protein
MGGQTCFYFNSDPELVAWATKHACRLVESKRQRPREIQINKEGPSAEVGVHGPEGSDTITA